MLLWLQLIVDLLLLLLWLKLIHSGLKGLVRAGSGWQLTHSLWHE
jgi:hypothetical protein